MTRQKLDGILQNLTVAVFHLGIVLLPLTFSFATDELFEFNKMLLVYLWASLTGTLWLSRMLVRQQWLLIASPVNWVVALFVLSQMLATAFSMHPYTSVFGYYSRFHGGLLSTLSYAVLLLVFVSTFARLPARTLWYWLGSVAIGSAAAVLYAIPEHFGYSPSCLLASGTFSVDCWVQDVQNRIFGTFGQPNWLAAYVVLLLPLGLSLMWQQPRWRTLLSAYASRLLLAGLGVISLAWLLTLLYTKSRSGLVGLAAGLIMSGLLLGLSWWRQRSQHSYKHFISLPISIGSLLLLTGVVFWVGTPVTPSLQQLFTRTRAPLVEPVVGAALEVGGTESGEIRKIVWRGALDVWRRYPIFGSGVETFAYSYYADRPVAHNLVSEWDFLYNKAHNEWLNMLATTGLVGIFAYTLWVATPYVLGVRLLWRKSSHQASKQASANQKLLMLIPGLLGGLTALHVSNFFGFSTVTVTVLQYLWTALIAIMWYQQSVVPHTAKPHNSLRENQRQMQTLQIWQWLSLGILSIICLVLVQQIYSIWQADRAYAQGKALLRTANFADASEQIIRAISLRPREALFYSTLGKAYAEIAAQLVNQDNASESAVLVEQAQLLLDGANQLNPIHYTLLLTRIGALMQLGKLDDQWLTVALADLDRAQELSPNDPRPHLLRSRIFRFQNQLGPARDELLAAVALKPNHIGAQTELVQVAVELQDWQLATTHLQQLLALDPDNPDALDLQQQIEPQL